MYIHNFNFYLVFVIRLYPALRFNLIRSRRALEMSLSRAPQRPTHPTCVALAQYILLRLPWLQVLFPVVLCMIPTWWSTKKKSNVKAARCWVSSPQYTTTRRQTSVIALAPNANCRVADPGAITEGVLTDVDWPGRQHDHAQGRTILEGESSNLGEVGR